MRIAAKDGCVVITEDLGFGEMVFRDRMATMGVVLLRHHAGTPATRAQNLLERMPEIDQRMPGWFVVVEDGNTRWREL